METVTASDLRKDFDRYHARARKGVIEVTSQGGGSVVLLPIEDYERLKAMDDRVALHPADLPDDLSEELDRALEEMKDVEAADLIHHGPR